MACCTQIPAGEEGGHQPALLRPKPRAASGGGIRLDTHCYPGYLVPPFYDSMIAKVIVHAPTRELAIARMRRALEAMVVEGIKTTIPLHLKIMNDPNFQAGNISTRFLDDFLTTNGNRTSANASAALTGAAA